MANYWLIANEVKVLVNKLNSVFAPYLDSLFVSDGELLDTMNDAQNTFLEKNKKYVKYMRWIKITFYSTKFKKDDKEIWRFDEYEVASTFR